MKLYPRPTKPGPPPENTHWSDICEQCAKFHTELCDSLPDTINDCQDFVSIINVSGIHGGTDGRVKP